MHVYIYIYVSFALLHSYFLCRIIDVYIFSIFFLDYILYIYIYIYIIYVLMYIYIYINIYVSALLFICFTVSVSLSMQNPSCIYIFSTKVLSMAFGSELNHFGKENF